MADQLSLAYREIESQMRVLCQRLAELRYTETIKRRQAAECSAMLSKIRLLPSELLSEIFIHCLPDMPSPSADEAPLLLCHITSSWRQLALHLPPLWRRLWIPRGCSRRAKSDELNLDSLEVPVSFWLERLGRCPMDLSLNSLSWQSILQLLRSLGPRSDIIQQLTLYSPRGYPVDLEQQPEPRKLVKLNALRTLSLHLGAPIPTGKPILLDTPNLRRISLDLHSEGLSNFIRWPQITHLYLPGQGYTILVSTFRDVLRLSSSLEEAEVSIRHDSKLQQTGPFTDVVTTMQNFTRLAVDVRGSCDLDILFHGFEFPALSSLKLYATHPFFTWRGYSSFSGELIALTHLTLSNVAISIHDLLAVIRANRPLISLHLHVHHDVLDVMDTLRSLTCSTMDWIGPHLQDVRIVLPSLDTDSPLLAQAAQLIHSRSKTDIAASKMHLTLYFTPDVMDPFEVARLQGRLRNEFKNTGWEEGFRWTTTVLVHRGFKI